jgi:hypothetical protein
VAGGDGEGAASGDMVPRLVLREPVEGGRSVYSGARRVDGLHFLVQVVTLVEPPTPRHPTQVRVALSTSSLRNHALLACRTPSA